MAENGTTLLTAARAAAGKVQGRRTTAPPGHPLEVPVGDWVRTLLLNSLAPTSDERVSQLARLSELVRESQGSVA